MKKQIILFSAVLSLSAMTFNAKAQINQGGLPTSFQTLLHSVNVPVHNFDNPDWQSQLNKEKGISPSEKFSKPYVGGLIAATDFSFPASGVFTVQRDGSRVWQGIINIEGAPSVGLLFDQFKLPKGVKLFLTNGNKRQVVGAFDASNNDASGKFAIDVVQGSMVFVELDIDADVKLDQINVHVNKAMVLHRGIEHLRQYAIAGMQTIDQLDAQLNGQSSVCTINAICPQGSNYPNPRKATIQTILPDGQFVALCSGTLVNNTGNTTSNCKARILTATHCEETGTLANADFDQAIIRFNFERASCSNTSATNGSSMTGVNVLGRSFLASTTSPGQIDGDFMVYEMRQTIPSSYGAVLSGWNRSNAIATTVVSPKKFIGFHHPAGDNKKVTTSQQIASLQNQTSSLNPNGNRWATVIGEGYLSGGSSGSALFDGDGYVIGVASTAGEDNPPASCQLSANGDPIEAMTDVFYQKIWHVWDYATDGTANNRKLRPWLDPAGTGATIINSVSSTCTTLTTGGGTNSGTAINNTDKELDGSVSVFPNPSADGLVQFQYNLKNSATILITVVDVTGKTVFSTTIKDAKSGNLALDLTNLSTGIYLVKINAGNSFTTKKLMLK